MRSFLEASEFGGRKQSDVAGSPSPDNHGILLVDHLVENAGEIFTQSCICCFPGHHAPPTRIVQHSCTGSESLSNPGSPTRGFPRPRDCVAPSRLNSTYFPQPRFGTETSVEQSLQFRQCLFQPFRALFGNVNHVAALSLQQHSRHGIRFTVVVDGNCVHLADRSGKMTQAGIVDNPEH